MFTRLGTASLRLCTVGGCGRHDAQTDEELALERRDLVAIYGNAGNAWCDLKRDLTGGRFWMAWKYWGEPVWFIRQPVFDPDPNPISVSILRTPLWSHVSAAY